MSKWSFDLPRSFKRFPKIQRSTGILESNGTPDPDCVLDFSSNPPKRITSPFFTLTMDSNFWVVELGGALSSTRPEKSFWSTLMVRVTYSSALTNGLITTERLASMDFQILD